MSTPSPRSPREGYPIGLEQIGSTTRGPSRPRSRRCYPNIDHALIRSGRRSPLANLDRNFLLYERPLLNLCNSVWADAINDAARERRLSVMLVGGLGNMTLSYAGAELLPELLRAGRLAACDRRVAWHAPPRCALAWRGGERFGPWSPLALWRLANRVNGAPSVAWKTTAC